MRATIQLQDIWKRYQLGQPKNLGETLAFFSGKKQIKDFWVLKRINLFIKKGEFLGIIGSNGSGKSTLLRVISGITSPSKGKIETSGKIASILELGSGFHPDLTGRENAYLYGTVLGMSYPQIKHKLGKIFEFAQIEKFIDTPLKHYSAGMQAKLAFSVAIQSEPDILLVDEVLAVGDAAFQSKCLSFFQSFKQTGRTIVVVTHDLSAVGSLCDRAVLLDHGKIIADGSVNKVTGRYMGLVANQVEAKKTSTPKNVNQETTDRFGDGKAKVIRFWVEEDGKTTQAVTKSEFTVGIEVEYHAPIKDSVPGVIIHNLAGQKISASNSSWAGFSTGSYKKGDRVKYYFRFPNFLEVGEYLISVNIVQSGTHHVYDWRNNILTINSVRPFRTGGLVNPKYEVYARR